MFEMTKECLYVLALYCKELSDPVNGEVTYTQNRQLGSEAAYTCLPGYYLHGNLRRRCLLNNTAGGYVVAWTGNNSVCNRKS